MCIGIFSFRAFDRRLARLAAPISSRVRQGGGQNLPPPPSGARSAEYPSGARAICQTYGVTSDHSLPLSTANDNKEKRRTLSAAARCQSLFPRAS